MRSIKLLFWKIIKMFPEPIENKIKILISRDLPSYKSEETLEKELNDLYFKYTGENIDFKDPITFNEKLQWMKLYYNSRLLPRVVDKCQFKKYIREKLGEGYTVPVYGAWSSTRRINWKKLPKSFVLKSNCCSDGKYIKIIKNKDEVDFKKLKSELKNWLNPYKTLINSYCRAYWNVKPMILAEKYVEQLEGQVYDYKFFCFNGEPKFAYVATDHFEGQISNISIYDLDWNILDITYGVHPKNNVSAPKSLDKMIEFSKILSKDFPFVRVDFFEIDGNPLLSELTLYPGGGFNKVYPECINKEWGDMLTLPKKEY